MKEDGIEKLHQLLEKETWPSVYMFKVIFPAEHKTYALVRGVFPDEARFFEKTSSGGKFVSVTVKELMMNADEVITRYKKLSEIDGLLIL